MVDVSEEVYDTVVVPFKKSRKFSELINSLLTGYLKDNYVASYVEGTLDTLKNESARSLDEAIASMNQSFAMVGMLADEASDMMFSGIDAVKVKEGNVPKGFETTKTGLPGGIKVEAKAEPSREDENLRKEVDDLKKQNEEMNRNLKMVLEALQTGNIGGLRGMSEGTVESKVEKEEAVQGSKEVASTVETIEESTTLPEIEVVEQQGSKKDDYDPLGDDISFGDEDISDDIFSEEPEDDDEDDDFLNGLLQGQVMSV